PLPDLAAGAIIDGATQTAFSGNTNTAGPEIVLDGSQCISQCAQGNGLRLTAPNCVIRGVVIENFPGNGIQTDGASSVASITGCYIGVAPDGITAAGNGMRGIMFEVASDNNIFGGESSSERNVISGNNYEGIHVTGNNNLIVGNFVGLNALGTSAI